MTATPPPAPTRPPTIGVSTTWPYLPQSHVPAATIPQQPFHQQPQPVIPVLPADHHHALDWPKIRRTAKAGLKLCCRPAILTGLAASPLYAHWVLPLAEQHSVPAIVGVALITTVYSLATRSRGLAVAVLVATTAGTVQLAPAALAHHLMGI
ncbi:hypothetical protein [Kitasatospora griseola]|uniref:hypothetical protein n=1 Tax=Kitasatospora griseola TaxID=2064 RepID=UPI003804167D